MGIVNVTQEMCLFIKVGLKANIYNTLLIILMY